FVNYDQLAEQYRSYRRPDPRIAARIQFHIDKAKRVLNVGAGMGSYEPENCNIVAIEPSHEMITRRKNSKATLIQGVAENLPFRDNVFDISMGILTIHHWSDIVSGLKEMARVSKNKLILFTWIGYGNEFWLENYIPEIKGVDYKLFPSLAELERILGDISVETIEIPYDCSDGFMCAYWRRPEAYLDPRVRKAISTFSRIPDIQERVERLQNDIYSGAWRQKHSHLLGKESLDLGYRLVVCETPSA
ncbi:MAG: class I SAM-dependent methyltransferase, partial [Thermodesulfobacteriota bacterium]|nr:class I SAM-dependent methyltransferase [Thermodesulfobacteriota bacterium]